MIFTADQIVAHLVGDYILQSHWMATEKGKQHFAAALHAICYTLPFLLITQSIAALAVICGTHFVIDRWRLARFVVWLKNGPLTYTSWSVPAQYVDTKRPIPGVYEDRGSWSWRPLTSTGYLDDTPPFLAVWLLIIADNTLHLICNGLAIWSFAA